MATIFANLGGIASRRIYGRHGHSRNGPSIDEQLLGPDHPSVGIALGNLAYLRVQTGDYPKDEAVILRHLEIAKQVYGDQHPEVDETLGQLAEVYCKEKKFSAADAPSAEAISIVKVPLRPDHPEAAAASQTRAEVL